MATPVPVTPDNPDGLIRVSMGPPMANPTMRNPAWDKPAPDVPKLMADAEAQHGLPPGILAAYRQVESSGGVALHSGKADGSMQFAPATARALGIDPMDDTQAIPAAAKLIRANIDASGGDLDHAAKMYYGGPNPAHWGPLTAAYPGKIAAAMVANAPLSSDNPFAQGAVSANTSLRTPQSDFSADNPFAQAAVGGNGAPLHDNGGAGLFRPVSASPAGANVPLGPGVDAGAISPALGAAPTDGVNLNSVPMVGANNVAGQSSLSPVAPLGTNLFGMGGADSSAAAGGPQGSGAPSNIGLNAIPPPAGMGQARPQAPASGSGGFLSGLSDFAVGASKGLFNGIGGGGAELLGRATDGLGWTHGQADYVAAERRYVDRKMSGHQYSPGGTADTAGNIGGQVLGTLPLGALRVLEAVPWLGAASKSVASATAAGTKASAIARIGAAVARIGDAAIGGAAGNMIAGNPGSNPGSNATTGAAIGVGIGVVSPLVGRAIGAISPHVEQLAAAMRMIPRTTAEDAAGNAIQNSIDPQAIGTALINAGNRRGLAANADTVALAAGLKNAGKTRGIATNPNLHPDVSANVAALNGQGVPIDQAIREAEAAHVGVTAPLTAHTTRNFGDWQSAAEGMKATTPEGVALRNQQDAANGQLHGAVQNVVTKLGGAPAEGEAISTVRQALADASDASKKGVSDLYKAADAESATAKEATDAKTMVAQHAADSEVAWTARTAARAKLDEAQDAFRSARTTVGSDMDKARARLMKTRDALSSVTNNPPTAARVKADPPGYIDLSELRQHLDSPELVDPTTDGLGTLRNGAARQIDALSDGSGMVTARQAENIRQTIADAYDTLGGGINRHVGQMKAIVDTALDKAENGAGPAYKAARAAHREHMGTFDAPGVIDLTKRDASGAFVKSDAQAQSSILTGTDPRKLANVVDTLKATGNDSALDQLRAEVVQKAHDLAGRGAADGNNNAVFSSHQFDSHFDKMGAARTSALFEPDQLSTLSAISRTAHNVNVKPPEAANTSGTASASANMIRGLITGSDGAGPKRSLTAALLNHVPLMAVGLGTGHAEMAGAAALGSEFLSHVTAGRTASNNAKALADALKAASNPATARTQSTARNAKLAQALIAMRNGSAVARSAAPAGTIVNRHGD